MRAKPIQTCGPFEVRVQSGDAILGPPRRDVAVSQPSPQSRYVVLNARYPQFPKDGPDLLKFAERVVEAFRPATIVLQVQNRLPGRPMGLVVPRSWEVLRRSPDEIVVRIQPNDLQPLADCFDSCRVRAYWLLSILPGGSETAFPSLVDDDNAPITPPPTGGVTFFVDTDDCNVWAIMQADDPAAAALLTLLNHA